MLQTRSQRSCLDRSGCQLGDASALLVVLEATGREMHTNEIIEKLQIGGRRPGEDKYAAVAATLNMLVKEGKLLNQRRGYFRIAGSAAAADAR